MKKTLSLAILFASLFNVVHAAQTPCDMNFVIEHMVVTSALSTNNQFSIQNAMSSLDKNSTNNGHISQNITGDPKALNRPRVFRACDIMNSPLGYPMWDGTNSPSGPFAGEYGKRAAEGFNISSSNAFLASEIYFELGSLDPANSLRYVGNIATNTANGMPLAYSTMLRGEKWNADGTVTSYYSGESIATTPVNRVIGLIRVGYFCANTNQTALTLNYFRDHLPFTNFAKFYRMSGGQVMCSKTLATPSLPYWFIDKSGAMHFEGQRNIPGMSYTVQSTHNLNRPINWQTFSTGAQDGNVFNWLYDLDTLLFKQTYYRCFETFAAPLSTSYVKSKTLPQIQVDNGLE